MILSVGEFGNLKMWVKNVVMMGMLRLREVFVLLIMLMIISMFIIE